MKPILQLSAICLLTAALSGCATYRGSSAVQGEPSEVTYQAFYDALSPYGNWINYPGYGNAWIPGAGPAFQPYATNGHWVYTDYGWTWASDYSWGWAPFHYGNWLHDGNYGWVWIPGYQWGPAWVTWRRTTGYYGWAPLGPAYGPLYGSYQIPVNQWVFVPQQYITSPYLNRYYIEPGRNSQLMPGSTVIRNGARGSRAGGPPVREVQQATHAPVRTFHVSDAGQPEAAQVSGNRLQVYRPRISSNGKRNNRKAQPSNNESRPVRTVQPRSSQPEQRSARPQRRQQPATNAPTRERNNNTGSEPVRTLPQRQSQPAPSQQNEAPARSVQPSGSSGGRPVRSPR